MTPTFQSATHRLVLSNVPHARDLLDALNPHGMLRVLDLKLDRPHDSVLQSEICIAGLDPIEAELWTAAHSEGPLLRVQTPTRSGRAGMLWFGRIHFEQLPQAYVCLELPLATRPNPNERDSFMTLTTCNDQATIDAWAADERERLAEDGVERFLRPVIQQAEQFDFEAVALGLRTAMLHLAPTKAAGLLACTVPVLMTGWIRACTQVLTLTAPRLTRVAAELSAEYSDGESPPGHPSIDRLRLTGSHGESLWVRPSESETHWEEDEQQPQIERLRALTGTGLETPEAVVSFLEDLAALMALRYRAQGATEINLPSASGPSPGDPDRPPQFD